MSVSYKDLELFACKDKSDEILSKLVVKIDSLFVSLILLHKIFSYVCVCSLVSV